MALLSLLIIYSVINTIMKLAVTRIGQGLIGD